MIAVGLGRLGRAQPDGGGGDAGPSTEEKASANQLLLDNIMSSIADLLYLVRVLAPLGL